MTGLRYAHAVERTTGGERLRRCNGCALFLPLRLFTRNRTSRGGRRSECRFCRNHARRR